MRQQVAIDQAARGARQQRPAIVLLDLRARRLHQLAVLDAGRARGFAGAAIQALVDVLNEGITEREAPLVHQNHLPDAAARRIRLQAPQAIRRDNDSGTGRSERIARSRRRAAGLRRGIRWRQIPRHGARRAMLGVRVTGPPEIGPGRGCLEDRKRRFNFSASA